MKTNDLLIRVEELFKEKLQAKTGWGRNEIIRIYQDAVLQALVELVESMNTPVGVS